MHPLSNACDIRENPLKRVRHPKFPPGRPTTVSIPAIMPLAQTNLLTTVTARRNIRPAASAPQNFRPNPSAIQYCCPIAFLNPKSRRDHLDTTGIRAQPRSSLRYHSLTACDAANTSPDNGCYNRPRLSPYTIQSNGARDATGMTMLKGSPYTNSSANPADHRRIAQSGVQAWHGWA